MIKSFINSNWKPFWFSIFFFLFFFTNIVFGQVTYYSQGNGIFNTVSLWHINSNGGDNTGRPNSGDFQNGNNTFIIQVGDTITVEDRLSGVNLVVNGYLIFNDDRVDITSSITVSSTATIDFNNNLIDTSGIDLIIEDGVEFLNLYQDPVTNVVTSGFSTMPIENFLPVELISFDTYIVGSDVVKLVWKTASERDNYGFEVYRRNNTLNFDWEFITKIRGKGSSNEVIEYYTFDNIPVGLFEWEYKLKQIDFDGHFEYSEIILHDNSSLNAEYKTFIDLNGREVSKPKANTMYIIPNGGKIMYIED